MKVYIQTLVAFLTGQGALIVFMLYGRYYAQDTKVNSLFLTYNIVTFLLASIDSNISIGYLRLLKENQRISLPTILLARTLNLLIIGAIMLSVCMFIGADNIWATTWKYSIPVQISYIFNLFPVYDYQKKPYLLHVFNIVYPVSLFCTINGENSSAFFDVLFWVIILSLMLQYCHCLLFERKVIDLRFPSSGVFFPIYFGILRNFSQSIVGQFYSRAFNTFLVQMPPSYASNTNLLLLLKQMQNGLSMIYAINRKLTIASRIDFLSPKKIHLIVSIATLTYIVGSSIILLLDVITGSALSVFKIGLVVANIAVFIVFSISFNQFTRLIKRIKDVSVLLNSGSSALVSICSIIVLRNTLGLLIFPISEIVMYSIQICLNKRALNSRGK